jgi:hypothetical protein
MKVRNMFYLLTILINITNFNPVITKDCILVNASESSAELEKAVKEMKRAGFSCEKNPDTLVYNCQNLKSAVIGKALLLKNKDECKSFPKKFSSDLKILSGK